MTAKRAVGWSIIALVFVLLFAIVAVGIGTTNAALAFGASFILTACLVFAVRLTV